MSACLLAVVTGAAGGLGSVSDSVSGSVSGGVSRAATAGPPPAPSVATDRDVVLPVDGPVTRFFVRPPERWSPGHRGVDLAAEPGAAVRSPISGVVEFSGPVAGRTVITVVRADGLRSSLEPLADVLDVGTQVAAGDVLGVLAPSPGTGASATGAAHCPPASCVHWGARRDGEYVDPLGLLEPDPIVLLPWR